MNMNDNVFYNDWSFLPIEKIIDRLCKGFWKVKVFEDLEAYLRKGSPALALETPNGITDEGIHYLLEVGFRSDAGMPVSQIAPWYAGLIDASGFTGLDASDTMSSHSGWSEATAYSESVRQTFGFAAAASRAISDDVSFSINASKTIQGLFVPSDNTKSGTSGTLWSTAEFSSPPVLISGNVLTANYSLSD